ncbi:hypothetical protein WJX81_006950 [Elliptochloris bilobata]|uniref:Uncharacterized protein n=1 Tax=Elliptochloris bilobata TaxID=381761 RepID=A0AAW1QN66_9CHLO
MVPAKNRKRRQLDSGALTEEQLCRAVKRLHTSSTDSLAFTSNTGSQDPTTSEADGSSHSSDEPPQPQARLRLALAWLSANLSAAGGWRAQNDTSVDALLARLQPIDINGDCGRAEAARRAAARPPPPPVRRAAEDALPLRALNQDRG